LDGIIGLIVTQKGIGWKIMGYACRGSNPLAC